MILNNISDVFPRHPDLVTKEKYSLLPVLSVLLVSFGALFVWETVQRTENGLRDAWLMQARLVTKLLDPADIASLSGNDADLAEPAYQRLKRQVVSVKKAGRQYRFVYLLGRKPDKQIFFFVDNESPDSSAYSPPGQIFHEASARLEQAFTTGTGFVEGPEPDRRGTWVSAFMPLRNPQTGKTIAVLGMDIDVHDWQQTVFASVPWPMSLIALIIVLIAVGYALEQSRRRLVDHQARLNQSREEFVSQVTETENQRRLLESLLDAIPAPVFFKDRNGRYIGCNRAFEKTTGMSEKGIIGKRPQEVWPEKYGSTYRDKDIDLLRTGGRQQYEFKYAGVDGEERDVIFYKTVFKDRAGEIDGIVGVMLDIAEHKRAEAEREQVLAALEQSGEGVIITDHQGTIQYVNGAFEEMTGYKRMEAIGKNPRILKSGQQDPGFYQQLWNTISGGSTFTGRMVNKRKNGSLYTAEVTISPVHESDGRIVNYVAVKRDITEHIRLAARIQYGQKMQAIGRLAGGVAHEFNNMLSVILGQTELVLQEVSLDTPIHDSLEEILGAARRSSEVTRQLLAFARMQMISPKVIDINNTLQIMLKMLRRLIGEEIKLVWRPGKDIWPVNMDPAQIDQILVNLLTNARDALAGVGTIIIETANIGPDEAYCISYAGLIPGDYVLLTVSDNGRGMDEETLANLFEPFFTTKDMTERAGLGLATVYGIVKQNNGFIYVRSEPRQGTAFRIYLPRYAEEPILSDDIGPEKDDNPGSGETVLVVEDEPSILKLIRRILEKHGYTVMTAATPSQALKSAAEHEGRIDLMITDVILPEVNGRELAEQLQAIYTDLKTIYMSGYAADAIDQRGILGADINFIQKPFSGQSLIMKVKAALNNS